jgi:hypothetical protein
MGWQVVDEQAQVIDRPLRSTDRVGIVEHHIQGFVQSIQPIQQFQHESRPESSCPGRSQFTHGIPDTGSHRSDRFEQAAGQNNLVPHTRTQPQ